MVANSTIGKLNQINHNFYQKVGTQFDATRQKSWPGWETLWTKLSDLGAAPQAVADIGCGNGRFLNFLAEKGFAGKYLGVDSSALLLEFAKQLASDIATSANISAEFNEIDLVVDQDALIKQLTSLNPDLIVLFGVMHHIPSTKFRTYFIKSLAASLKPGGYLCFTTWEFQSDPRYSARSLNSNEIAAEFGELELEEGDFILDWKRGERAFRYCHAYSNDEVNEIVENAGLKIAETFLADGKNSSLNRYYILRRL